MIAWDRTQWELTVLNAGLPAGPVKTALALAVYAGDEGVAWPGERQLARVSRQSRSAVWGHLRRLREAGLVRPLQVRPEGSPVLAAGYQLVIPS